MLGSAAAANAQAATASFPAILIEGAGFERGWRALDPLVTALSEGTEIPADAEPMLAVLIDTPMSVSWEQRETLILRLLDALLAYKAGSWPGGEMPPALLALYNHLSRFDDRALRARVIVGMSRLPVFDTKPLVLESASLLRAFELLDRQVSQQPVPIARFPEDLVLEEEARAIVIACRGRVNYGLALALSDIARYSRNAGTVKEAQTLARQYWASASRQNSANR